MSKNNRRVYNENRGKYNSERVIELIFILVILSGIMFVIYSLMDNFNNIINLFSDDNT